MVSDKKRELVRELLKFRGNYKQQNEENTVNGFKIRVWTKKSQVLYDCSCNGRIPSLVITETVKNVKKIKEHMKKHDPVKFKCALCNKKFDLNHFQLNAHMKIHKKGKNC
ncbi:hypothetical protein MHBO_004228, partial [Bonamia ostreae]